MAAWAGNAGGNELVAGRLRGRRRAAAGAADCRRYRAALVRVVASCQGQCPPRGRRGGEGGEGAMV